MSASRLVTHISEADRISVLQKTTFGLGTKGGAADYDEHKATRRREGSINASYSCLAHLRRWHRRAHPGGVGFDAKTSHQPPEVLRRMISLYLIIPVIIWAIACYYPLNRKRMAEIRQQLEARRGVI